MPKTSHDDVVLEVGLAIADLGVVHADIDPAYCGSHSFRPKLVLADAPQILLSALVPTQAIFSRRVAFPNPDWKEPDLAIDRNVTTYIVDVYDDNDNFTSVARKIETVLANATSANIAGIAVVAKGCGRPYAGKLRELERLRETFHLLLGKPAGHWAPDDCRAYLQPLFEHPAVRATYGAVDWDRVLALDVAASGWRDKLRGHIETAFGASGPIVERRRESGRD